MGAQKVLHMLPAFLPSAPSLEALGQSEWQEARRRTGLGDGAILEAVLESPRLEFLAALRYGHQTLHAYFKKCQVLP